MTYFHTYWLVWQEMICMLKSTIHVHTLFTQNNCNDHDDAARYMYFKRCHWISQPNINFKTHWTLNKRQWKEFLKKKQNKTKNLSPVPELHFFSTIFILISGYLKKKKSQVLYITLLWLFWPSDFSEGSSHWMK